MGEAGQTLLWPASMALDAVVPQRSAGGQDTAQRAETAREVHAPWTALAVRLSGPDTEKGRADGGPPCAQPQVREHRGKGAQLSPPTEATVRAALRCEPGVTDERADSLWIGPLGARHLNPPGGATRPTDPKAGGHQRGAAHAVRAHTDHLHCTPIRRGPKKGAGHLSVARPALNPCDRGTPRGGCGRSPFPETKARSVPRHGPPCFVRAA